MTDDPNFKFDVTGAEIEAAVARGDYEWLCKHVFNPALVQFIRHKHTNALLNNPTPRARRATPHHRTRRSTRFRP